MVDGKPKRYTIPQIIEVLNEYLLFKQCILTRTKAGWELFSTAEKIDPARLPQITFTELKDRARTEPVSVVVPLDGLKAPEFVDDVRKLLGPLGDVALEPKLNAL